MLLLFCLGVESQAQSETPRVEVGAQFSLLRLQSFELPVPLIDGVDTRVNEVGVGGLLVYNLNDWLALEGALTFFPKDRDSGAGILPTAIFFDSGRKVEAVAGVKAGLRSEKAGLFGKFRPGVMRFGRAFKGGSGCLLSIGPGGFAIPDSCFGSQTSFALDIGGVVELYPSRSIGLRFDLGNTFIVGRDRRIEFPLIGGIEIRGNNSSNLELRAGINFRF